MIYDVLETETGRDYDAYALDDLAEVCRKAYNALVKIRDEFDSITVTGMSGVVVGVPVALKLKKPVVIVRKDKDDSHQGPSYGGIINRYAIGERTVFLDDFVSCGDTRNKVFKAAESLKATVVASYLYRDDEVEHHGDAS